MVSDEALASLPKAHLHLHLTGGMRHDTLIDLARTHGIQLPERLSDEVADDWRVLGWGRDIVLPLLPLLPVVKRQMLLTVTGLKGGFLKGRLSV